MARLLIMRIAAIIPMLVAISVLAFGLHSLAPGDPARLLVEASGLSPAPPEAVAAKRAELKLDQPIATRYVTWLAGAAQGDLGRSYRTYEPVSRMYLERLPATLALAAAATLISATVAIPLGIFAAFRHGTSIDRAAQFIAVFGAAAPGFWVALMLTYLFGARLGWLPVFGSVTPRGIILPALVVALPFISILTRLTRASALDVLSSDFINVARMKGLRESAIALRHALPNVLVQITPLLSLELAGLLSGAAVVEYVFAWPGIGRLAVDSALLRDTPVVVGFAVATGIAFALANLAADIIIALIDPRQRAV